MEADVPIGDSSRRAPGMPSRLLGDERLAQAVGAGNEHAFTTLFKRYHQQLYRYCRSITGNDQDAQDALQSALTKALIALRQGRRNAPVRPWLFRIAHNESISLIRGRSVAQDLPLELEASQAVVDSVEERERLALLIADLRELPDRQRGALVMRELSGLSHEEIAQALQVSVGAAKQVILEARRSLMEFAEGRAMTCDAIEQILSDADRRSLRSRKVRAHLRGCSSCSAFAAAIPRRRTDMLALSPALPAAGAAGLLAKLTGAGSGHGGGGAGLVAGTAAKGVGVTISAKVAAAAGAAVVATATVGAVTVLHHSAPAKPAVTSHPAVTAGHTSAANAGTGHAVALGHNRSLHGRGAGGLAGHGRARAAHGNAHSPARGRNHAHHGARGNASLAHWGNAANHGHSTTHGNSLTNSGTHGNSASAPGHSVTTSSLTTHGRSQTAHAQSVKPNVTAAKHAKRTAVHTAKRRRTIKTLVRKKSKAKKRSTARRHSQAETTANSPSATSVSTTDASTVTTTSSLSGTNNGRGNTTIPPGQGGSSPANKAATTP